MLLPTSKCMSHFESVYLQRKCSKVVEAILASLNSDGTLNDLARTMSVRLMTEFSVPSSGVKADVRRTTRTTVTTRAKSSVHSLSESHFTNSSRYSITS